jgi:hypothetical protein
MLTGSRRTTTATKCGSPRASGQECGIRVDPHTTITSIVSALEERTDVDLQDHLAAHLAARFGAGPLPPPWPEHACRKGWATYRETNSTKGRGKARGEESRKSPTN